MVEENKIYTGREFIEKCVKKHELLQEKDPEQLQENIRKIEEDKEKEIIVEGIQPDDYWGQEISFDTRFWKKVTFEGDVRIEDVPVIFDIFFPKAEFKGNCTLKRHRINSLSFDYSEFKGNFTIVSSKMNGASFTHAKFHNGAYLLLCDFRDEVFFSDAKVEGGEEFKLKHMTFSKFVNFRSFESKISVVFKECAFNGPVYFDDITSFKSLKCKNSSFAFPMIDMRGVSILDELVMNDVYFVNAFLLRQREVKRWIGHGKKGQAAIVNDSKTFEFIERSLHSSGDYKLEDEVYIAKKLNIRELVSSKKPAKIVKWVLNIFNYGLFGLGRRLLPSMLFMLLVIVLFARIYWHWGWMENGNDFLDALYFSGITFVTVGYGDIKPLGLEGRLFTVVEGLSGLFLMAVFVVACARKMFRYK